MADQPFLNSGFQNFLNTAVPIGVRAKSSTSNLTPTPNTIGKGFVEPYSSVANTQYGNKSTENGTGGSSFMPKPPAPSVAQPPANPNARMTGQLNDLQSQLKAKQDQLAKQTAAGYTGNTQPQYDTQGNLVPFTQPNQGAGGTDQTKTSPYDYTQVIPGTNLTLPQLAAMMANRAQQPSPDYTAQQAHINDILSRKKALDTELAQQTANIEGTPGSLVMAGGQEGLLNRLYAGKSAALSGEYQGASSLLGAANTQQQTQQAGLGAAMGAVAPQQVPYNVQYTNPLTGQPYGGGGTSGSALSLLPTQAQQAVQSYAQQVQSGAMTRTDAESRLSAYGIAGTNALNEALGPKFNTNASNASAGTTAVGQQIQTAARATNNALDTLSNLFSNLSPAQTAGIPITNAISNWIATQLGSQALTTYKTNLADARSQLIGVLNSAGGTPTGNEATANQYLPDNMTKAQFDANVGTTQNPGIVRQLVQQKVTQFTQSGQQSTNTNANSTTSGVQYNSDGTLKAVSF